MVMDHQDRSGNFFLLKGCEYKVSTKFHSAGITVVNYNYEILRTTDQVTVLTGQDFNPSPICKAGDEWPQTLGWRALGELLREVCYMPEQPGLDWFNGKTEDQIDFLIGEDSEHLYNLGLELIESCKDLTFQV